MSEKPPTPPPTRVEPVVELFHGDEVQDPYRWLEDGDSAEVHEWVAAQNRYTAAVLSGVAGRESIARRLTELLNTEMVGTPSPRRGRYFYLRRRHGQNQPVLYVRIAQDGEERPLVNPNLVNEEGTTALDWYFPSRDGHLLAYGLSDDGSEKSTLRVLDVDSGEHLSDVIDRTRYTSLAWLPDGSGFYYSRLPAPGSVHAEEEVYHRRLYLHRLGESPDADELIWTERRDMRESPSVSLSPDGRWLLLIVGLGWDQADVYFRDLSAPGEDWITVAEDVHALFWGEIYDDTLYLFTNLDAPRYRMLATPISSVTSITEIGRTPWREVVPERPDAVLTLGEIAGGRLALQYLVNATSRLELRSLDGSLIQDIPLPALGSSNVFHGEPDGTELFFDYTSFVVPVTIYRLDLATGEVTEWASVPSSIDPAGVSVEQVWYDSTNGARVSIFIVERKSGVKQNSRSNGDAPLLLTGYGGFNISRLPAYSSAAVFWLEQGGIFALPNLRGGGEYGESWHEGGMLAQKQHSFDDFIGAAEYLIANGYTSPQRLAILGGSNGGLLVGAAITQRSELFRAAVCAVPLLDMLRYHRFLIARLWITEYGSAEDPEQYRWLRAYSPYHHTAAGVRYPAVLFTTAESDSRVDPLHARKMAALLQAQQGASPVERPVLLRVETQAGHGQGKPIAKLVEEQTDIWSFICNQLGVSVTAVVSPASSRA